MCLDLLPLPFLPSLPPLLSLPPLCSLPSLPSLLSAPSPPSHPSHPSRQRVDTQGVVPDEVLSCTIGGQSVSKSASISSTIHRQYHAKWGILHLGTVPVCLPSIYLTLPRDQTSQASPPPLPYLHTTSNQTLEVGMAEKGSYVREGVFVGLLNGFIAQKHKMENYIYHVFFTHQD